MSSRQRSTDSGPDAIAALVTAESPPELVAAYQEYPLLATDAALGSLDRLREAARRARQFVLTLAYQWRAEFLVRAREIGPNAAAAELFGRIAWLDRRMALVFVGTTIPAVEHLILTTYPYRLRIANEISLSSRNVVLEPLRAQPDGRTVPFGYPDGTPIPDRDRWRIAASLAWDLGAPPAANELELSGAVVLSTIGLALAAEDADATQVDKLRELRANVVLRCQRHDPDPGALDWAIFTAEEQLRTRPAKHVDLHNLRLLLLDRGHPEDTRRAEELTERLVTELTAVGNQELENFQQFRRVAHADAAINAYEHALRLLPLTGLARAGTLANLANASRERYDLTRDEADVTRAIEAGQQAAKLFDAGHWFRPGALSNVCLGYQARFVRHGRLADIEAAIEWGQAAVDAAPPDHHDRAKFLANLAQAHLLWSRLPAPDQAGLGEHLDRAIDRYTEAIATARPDDPGRPAYLANLAVSRTARASTPPEPTGSGELEALDTLNADDPRRAGIAYNLGTRLADQSLLRHAATLPTGPAHIRLRAAQAWGDAALGEQDLDTAVGAYRIAVEMLERLAWQGRDRDRQEAEIGARAGLAGDAAALAIRAGQPRRAVELLERGRSLMWGQLLHLRGDLARLAETDPDLAAALDEVRTRLDRPLDTPLTPGERLAALDTWADLLAQAQARPGFATFLQPVPFADLRLAVDGPVVIVNVSRFGCAALIVSGEPDVRVVELPTTVEQVTEYARRTRAAVATRQCTSAERERDRQELLDILDWLWTAIAEPVLTELGHLGVPAAEPARVWWCPTGPLAALPLHAAGRHSRTNTVPTDVSQTVAGRVVSSYTPTLAALAGPDPDPAPAGCLVVGVAAAPGLRPLPAVSVELDLLGTHLPDATYLVDADATAARVRSMLTGHGWVHLACHAEQDQDEPINSAFAMWDRRLTVAELTGLRTVGGALAYLAACGTAAGATQLPDEALHLAGTLQTMGYRQVIATLWAVRDRFACKISASVYGALSPGDPHPEAARALHAAVESMRARHPAEPAYWAPFLHTGR